MKDQLIQFLNRENISATKLADDIGVQRSSISHIVSGRNKPSYDFIEKLLTAYPALNAQWLITGKGSMYLNDETEQKDRLKNRVGSNTDLFTQPYNNNLKTSEKTIIETNQKSDLQAKNKDESQFTNVNKVEKIVFFYTGGIFKEYSPPDSDI